MKKVGRKHIVVSLFFLSLLFLGIFIFRDFGVHWDEYNNQRLGMRWARYVMGLAFQYPVNIVPKQQDLIHGPFIEIILALLAKVFRFENRRDILFFRHFAVFLIFYLGVFFYYKLCESLFKSWTVALLGSLMLVLHPRIFAHAFYNSVDIPFMSLYIISTYTLFRFIEKQTFVRVVLHSLSCAILIDIRIIGLILPLCTSVVCISYLIRVRNDPGKAKQMIGFFFLYLLLLIMLVNLFWPALWKSPFMLFGRAARTSGNFGMAVTPWYYNLRWIVITTPLFYSLCFLAGLLQSLLNICKITVQKHPYDRHVPIILFLFFVPILLPIIFRAYLYDDWRHHYFVYPVFLLIALVGLTSLPEIPIPGLHKRGRKIILTTVVLFAMTSLIGTAWFMVRYHPYQSSYGNLLAGRDMSRAKVDNSLDYWGLSYRKALEFVLENDPSDRIPICVANAPGFESAKILPRSSKKRLEYVNNPNDARYFITNFRLPWGDFPQADNKWMEMYSIKIRGTKIVGIYLNSSPNQPMESPQKNQYRQPVLSG